MGREIRRVPPDWEHPVDIQGKYIPLYDGNYRDACAKWWEAASAYQYRTYHLLPDMAHLPEPERLYEEYPYYWDWDGMPPDKGTYREREWAPEEATAYQIYETVSEGTPDSPIFATLPELIEWLVGKGYSRKAAEGFARHGSVPSMLVVIEPGGRPHIYQGIESAGVE